MKKYTLKPGLHQFAPGSPATHHNNNLTDAEAEWYLKRYPHIKNLFEITGESKPIQRQPKSAESPNNKSVKSKQKKSVKSPSYENLPATN